MSQTTVSVVIPTHDRPKFLVEAVESALAQTVDILEVIVIDDASKIDIRPLLAGFGDKVRYERLPESSGANVARNRGVELARGNIVGFLDDDDLWVPEKTALQLVAIESGAEACLCATRAMDGTTRAKLDRRIVDEDWLRESTPCGTSGLLVRREIIQTERFDPAIPRGQDWDVFVRLARRAPIPYVAQPLYLRRSGHARITTAALRKTPAELFASAAALHKHKDWLGRRAYHRRLARILLSFISQRQGKPRYIAAAIRSAGLRATVSELRRKVRH